MKTGKLSFQKLEMKLTLVENHHLTSTLCDIARGNKWDSIPGIRERGSCHWWKITTWLPAATSDFSSAGKPISSPPPHFPTLSHSAGTQTLSPAHYYPNIIFASSWDGKKKRYWFLLRTLLETPTCEHWFNLSWAIVIFNPTIFNSCLVVSVLSWQSLRPKLDRRARIQF